MFSGSIPALVTPFRGRAFDEAAYRDLVEWQIAEGSSALVARGPTRAYAPMSVEGQLRGVGRCGDQDEHEIVRQQGRGKAPSKFSSGCVGGKRVCLHNLVDQ